MAILKAPLKADAAGKCSRWRVILYNPTTHKQEWHTVNGTRRDAEAFERQQKTRVASGVYIAKAERRTFAEVAAMFVKERRARNRRTSTIVCYQTVLNRHLLSKFGPHEVGSIRRSDIAEYFDFMRGTGATVQTINRALRTMKAVLFFALERELVERNVMQRFRPFEGGKEERHVCRDAYSEAEVQAIIAAAKPHERTLIGLLTLAGLRPAEAFALEWSAVNLEAGCVRIVRSWDHRGRQFVAPKTKAGERTVPLSGWLVEELRGHRERSGDTGLVFANGNGKPLNPSNVRRDLWMPLKKRAGVRNLDLYSLRHTFASLGRTAGESAFNVARMMGHARSTLVDQVYAHTMQSGMASVASAITARALGEEPKLRIIDGGQRDVRESLESTKPETEQKKIGAL
jgi:integrase